MRYLIASDIHGAYLDCLFIVNKFNEGKFDKLILLGDILYHGPRNDLPKDYNPKGVISLLNPLADNIIAIKGNCEAYVDQMVLKFKILENRFLDINNKTYFLCHGHKLQFNQSDINIKATIIYGHYHIPSIKEYNGNKYINVGSIALPKENSPKTYAILDDDKLEILTKEDKIILNI